MEVFISWTGADRDVKNAIVERLRREEITCFDSDADCVSDYSPECIAQIKQCAVFIVLVSDTSMKQGYVKNEIIAARRLEEEGKLNILVYKLTDAPYTEFFEFQLNHISFVTGNLIQQTDSGIDAIVSRAKRLLQRRKEGDPVKPMSVFKPQIDALEITRPGYFVENSRDDILDAVEKALQSSNVVILSELFGFGKRSLVKKYAEIHRNALDSVLMLSSSRDNLRDFFLADLRFLNLSDRAFSGLEGDALLRAKLRQLEKLDDKTMLVIHNVKFESEPDELLCQLLGQLKCRLLLVTQESAGAYKDLFPVIFVGRMADEHLYELFFHRYDRAYEEEKEALKAPLKAFFDGIGGHTKTVELTASVLARDLGAEPEELPGYLSMSGFDGMQLKDRILRKIASLIDLETFRAEEKTALLAAALLAVEPMSEKDYRGVLRQCGVADWSVAVGLDARRWLDIDGANRTVTIEPLVAQIILNKFRKDYTVLFCCLEYLSNNLMNRFNLVAVQGPIFRLLSRLRHFFGNTELQPMAKIVELIEQKMLHPEEFREEAMARAIREFEDLYGQLAYDRADERVYDREHFVAAAAANLRELLLPTARLFASGLRAGILDFRVDQSSTLFESLKKISSEAMDLERVTGVSREELIGMLEQLRNDEAGEFTGEDAVWVAIFSLCEAISRRDHAAMMESIDTVLERMEEGAELEDDSVDLFYKLIEAIANGLTQSGASQAALALCRKVIQAKPLAKVEIQLAPVRIEALHNCREYTRELFSTYETLLEGFERYFGQSYDSRSELLTGKKRWVLQYAAALAAGEKPREAEKQFSAAMRMRGEFLPNNTAAAADSIVGAFANQGAYEEAARFIGGCLSEETAAKIREGGDETAVDRLEKLLELKELTESKDRVFASACKPEQYVSYYRTFLRENNGVFVGKYMSVAEKAGQYDFSDLPIDALARSARELRQRAGREKPLSLAPEAFALASEAGYRVLGYRHTYVQYMGAAAMAEGKIAEILNGEGKTYTVILTAFLNYLYGKKVFIVDASAYLTRRNHHWMHSVFALLGVRTGCITSSEEIYKKTNADQADVIYAELNALILGVIRGEVTTGFRRSYLRLDAAIIDEADSVLVDCAQRNYEVVTTQEDSEAVTMHHLAFLVAQETAHDEGFYSRVKGTVTLKPAIYPLIERVFRVSYADLGSLQRLREIERLVCIAISCRNYYRKDKDYFIHDGVPVLEDREKGTFTPMRSSYTYFLCMFNGLNPQKAETALRKKRETRNSISVRDFFRKFSEVCGTTATAASYSKEFREIYRLEYVAIPPALPCVRQDKLSPLYVKIGKKEEDIVEMTAQKHQTHQPVLLVCGSVSESERYSTLLIRAGISHRLLNAKNVEESADALADAGVSDSVLVTTGLANRGVDIRLGGDPQRKTRRELIAQGVDPTAVDRFLYTLPTEGQTGDALYGKYHSLLEKNKIMAAGDRRTVVEAGGLCVIATGFVKEPRTEQQIRGRSGRQGEIGESWVFYSLEDEQLQSVFSEAQKSWFQQTLEGESAVESKLIARSLKTAQKKLHEAAFATIYRCNDLSRYLDLAREDFIGVKFAVADGEMEIRDLLERWAGDKEVLRQLESLQKGSSDEVSPYLKAFFERNKGALEKGNKAGKRLAGLLNAEVDARYAVSGKAYLDLCTALIDGWKAYIAYTKGIIGSNSLSQRVMEQRLEEERQRQFRLAVEKFAISLT